MITALAYEPHWRWKVLLMPLVSILAICVVAARNQEDFYNEQFLIFGFFFLSLPAANGYLLKKLFLENILLIVAPFKKRTAVFLSIAKIQLLACLSASFTIIVASTAISKQPPNLATLLQVTVGMALGLVLLTGIHTVVFFGFKQPLVAYLVTVFGLVGIYVACGGLHPSPLSPLSPLHLIERLTLKLEPSSVLITMMFSILTLFLTKRFIQHLSLGGNI